MTDCISVAATTSTITYIDVIRKFKELKSIFYTHKGCMISTLDDNFSKKFLEKHPDLKWREKYNKHAEATVLTAKLNINIFGLPFKVYLHRPLKQIHRWEYEYFFGFGGHNSGFSYDRIIMTFGEIFDRTLDFEYLLMTGTLANIEGEGEGEGEGSENHKCCTIDEKYIKNALKLLVIGGYVKQWTAFNQFKQWFKDHGFLYELNTDNSETMTSFIFEDKETETGYSYEVVEE
jgi:hypothetical protein